jgi:hypothetical protein
MRIPSHSTVAAYAALFIAMGGTATAAVTLKANSVGSAQIRNGSVTMADLAKTARPSSKSILFRQAVTDVVLDPNTKAVVDSLAGAVKGAPGDPGPQGPQGVAVQGPQGADGPQGSSGPRGSALGFAHVSAGGVVDDSHTSKNAVIFRPGGSYLTCVKATDGTVKNVAVSLDANDAVGGETVLTRVPADGSGCAGYDFEVIVMDASHAATARGLFLTLN